MSKLEELYEKMVDEAPFIFPESNREYVFELARIYAKECCQATLEKASENVKIKLKDNLNELSMMDDWNEIDKKSIANPDNIVIL